MPAALSRLAIASGGFARRGETLQIALHLIEGDRHPGRDGRRWGVGGFAQRGETAK